VTRVHGASNVIGVIELIIGVRLAVRPRWPRACLRSHTQFSVHHTRLIAGVVGIPDEGPTSSSGSTLRRIGARLVLTRRSGLSRNSDTGGEFVRARSLGGRTRSAWFVLVVHG
jgi:hypothetical protein